MPDDLDAPLIGLTIELLDAPWYEGRRRFQLFTAYTDSLRTAGAIPLLIPTDAGRDELEQLLNKLDGVLMTGGDDADLSLLGGPQPEETCKPVPPVQQNMNLKLAELLTSRNQPVLGICLGMQMLGLFHGCGYIQHLGTANQHTEGTPHLVTASPHSKLAAIVGDGAFEILSYHHQALADCNTPLTIAARSEDGCLEAIERPDLDFCMGVQWHPEKTPECPSSRALFSAFVAAARTYRKASLLNDPALEI